jgi:outer membrane receptor for ferrienterochelin and colicin
MKLRLFQSIARGLSGLPVAALAAIMFLTVPVASNAQDTTSAIRGKIIDPAGAPVAGASVVVEDTRSGVTRNLTSNDDGLFLASRLLPGGPYRVTVNGTKTVAVPSISVGDTYSLTLNLQEEAAIEEIVTIGQTADFVEVASGPAATFNLADIENAVSFSRDISDVYGIDPRLMVDNDEDGFGVNCAGKHPRFNNVTLDGVSQTDRFGLNENGYSTAVGMPFPYDAIEQIAVELAPFDVTYGSFSACNINAVTKSGTNEWEGKVFYEYSDNDFRGTTVADDPGDYSRPSYDRTIIGFNVGGPIIKDRLFFHVAYEETDDPRFLARGYAGSGNGEERDWLSEADYNRIVNIAENIYGYDPGGLPGDGSQESEKYLVRLDWNINDRHNAALIYNYFDGFQDRDSDGDSNEFEFSNHFYKKGAESETTTFRLTSDWTDRLSTEVFYSMNTMDDSQVTVGPKDFADMQISVGGRTGTVYLGADDSRQANNLSTESNYLKLSADLFLGNQIITVGYDREDLEIFNIFVQHSRGGEYDYFDSSANNDPACAALTAQERFDGVNGCSPSGIDRFELGRPSRIYYGSGGGTNNPNDAAANFSNVLNSLYIQDEIFLDNYDLTITAGLRYEWFTSSDRPVYNDAFTQLNGVRNDANIDGLDLLMPRVGFNWDAREDLTVRGGVGLYSGGNPNVWISNAWSNDGVTNVQLQYDDDEFGDTYTVLPGSADSLTLSGQQRPGYDVPQLMVDDVAATTAADANTSRLVLIDPNYKQPNEWKLALGATWDVPYGDFTLDIDYLHTRGNDSAYYVDLSQEVVGTTAIGTPIYAFTNGSDNLMLTNSGENPVSNVFSIVAQKSFEDWGIDLLFGYAYTDAEDVSPMTSAVAVSNFDNTALLDVNNPRAANSNYVVPQRFTMRVNWERALFGDNLTRVTLFGYLNEGQPQSWGFAGSATGDCEDATGLDCVRIEGDGFFGRHLLYIPNGANDDAVVFGPDFDQAEFFAWVASEGLSPGITKRNDFNADWSTRFDLRIDQELPLPGDFSGRVYFKVYNFGNMLNDDWGKITDAQFFTPVPVSGAIIEDTGQLWYGNFSERSIDRVYPNRSLWEARLGIDIRFGQ